MTIHLTPEQEQRLHDVIGRGAYNSVDEVVEAALAAVELRSISNFESTEQELERLLGEGLTSKELTEKEFWESVTGRTDAMLRNHRSGGG
jgi:Arc/MetJ-type ribon-helix-helix transcriptional regulator